MSAHIAREAPATPWYCRECGRFVTTSGGSGWTVMESSQMFIVHTEDDTPVCETP